MNDDQKPNGKPLRLDFEIPSESGQADTFDEMQKAAKPSLLGRLRGQFNDALQQSRGSDSADSLSLDRDSNVTADDLAIRRAKDVAPKRLVVPEGVVISGSMSSGSETEISGRVEGDVNVEGRLYLGPSALVTGNIRAGSCKIEGLVEGKVECSQELDLTRTGRLNADATAGRKITVAGQIFGAVTTGGAVRILTSGRIQGNIQAKQIYIEEGAKFNGRCTMRALKAPSQRT